MDYGWLRQQELVASRDGSWRLGGQHPSPEHYAESLWLGVYCHFLGFQASDPNRECLGLATVYDVDLNSQVGYLAAVRFRHDLQSRADFLRVFAFTARYAFDTASLRKLYLDTPEYNFNALSSFVRRGVMTVEGCLVDRRFAGGRFWDQYILSLSRPQSAELEKICRVRTNV
jgi:hypothetical protein